MKQVVQARSQFQVYIQSYISYTKYKTLCYQRTHTYKDSELRLSISQKLYYDCVWLQLKSCMNKSCIRETGSTQDLHSTHQKQTNTYLNVTKKELSKSIEIVLIPRKQTDPLTKSKQEGSISVNMQSNLKHPKKSLQFKMQNKLERTNNSFAIKPRNLIFPRLYSHESSPQDKKMVIQRSKTSKKSVHLKRILTLGQSLRGEKKNRPNLNRLCEDYNESKLQKIGTESIFLLALPQKKFILSPNESFHGENQMKQPKPKRFDAPMFRQESSKNFLPNNPKKTRQ